MPVTRPPRKLSRRTLAVMLGVLLAFSYLLGVTAVSMGLGSIYPEINLVASPVACPGRHLAHSQQVTRHAAATYYTAEWFCTDDATREKTSIDPYRVHLSAGAVFGVVIFIGLLLVLHLYWHSSVGPFKNDGLELC